MSRCECEKGNPFSSLSSTVGLTLILGAVHLAVEVVMVRVLGLPALQPWIALNSYTSLQNRQIGKPPFDDGLPHESQYW